ncbi:MAG: diguanylate cyclase [Bermanella sp.]
MLESFEELEAQQMSENLSRIDSTLNRELGLLQVIVIDWAEWDDTYHYMHNRGVKYEQSNIVKSTFDSLNVSNIIYLDKAKNLRKDFSDKLKSQTITQTPTPFFTNLSEYHTASEKFSGILQLNNTLYMSASNEILKSDQSGPPRGQFIMLRLFDDEIINGLSKQILMDIEFIKHNKRSIIPFDKLNDLDKKGHWLEIKGANKIVGYSLLNDPMQNPLGFFKVTSSREIFSRGVNTLTSFTYFLAVSGLFFSVLVLWILRQILLKRLLGLSQDLIKIGNNNHSGKLVDVKGNDEITTVAKAVNQMLAGLERFYLQLQHHQEHQRIQNELLINLAKEPCLINGNVKLAAQRITEFILHGCQVNHASIWLLNETSTEFNCIDSLLRAGQNHQQGATLPVEDLAVVIEQLNKHGVLDIKNGHRLENSQSLLKIINPDKKPCSLYITPIHLKGGLHGFIIAQSFQLDSQYRLNDETFLLSISEFAEQTLVVQQRNRLEENLKEQVCRDNLTKLPNRHFFYELLNEEVTSAKINNHKLAILFIDLDNFKPVNDTYGHNIGDELLKMCAKRMSNAVLKRGTVARLGGDEFVVLLTSLPRNEDACNIAKKMVNTLSDIFSIQGKSIAISCSIGIAFFPQHSNDPDELVTLADNAMYQAKQQGRNNFYVYAGNK